MALPLTNTLVHETSTTTGTGNKTLVNANGKQSFNTAFGTGGTDKFYYAISNRDAAEYEWGSAHLSAASTLVVDTVLGGSNGTSAVNFSSGTKDVTSDIPAATQQQFIRRVVPRVFTASGTYTPSANMLYCIVECCGGGGGGGGIAAPGATELGGGGGGGGGAYSRVYLTAAQIGASQTVTIGAGGAGGSAGNNGGSAGGDTSLGSLCVGKGGSGGGGSSTGIGGAAGVAGTGDFTPMGNAGGTPISGNITTINATGAQGGPGPWGGVAVGAVTSGASAAGADGANYGAGGNGAYGSAAGAARAGGAGSSGVMIITEFLS